MISGVQTELVIDPGEVQPAGFKYSRAFSLAIPNAELTVVVTRGTEVTDDQGKKAKVLRVNVDHLMTTIFFGSVNA